MATGRNVAGKNGKVKTDANPNGAGRPSKRSEAVRVRILELVEAGDRGLIAAGRCGLGERTYREWLADDEEFRSSVACAERAFESKAREVVMAGDEKGQSFGPAKAALEVLSRRFPARWSQQIKVEIADQLNKFIDVAQRILEPKAFGELLEALAEEPGEGEAPCAPQPASPIH